MQFFSVAKNCIFVAILLVSIGCGRDSDEAKKAEPYLSIENGTYEVHAIVLQIGETGAKALGSGSISFRFSGDTTGTFSASGPLESNQQEADGVGAFLELLEDEDYGVTNEGFSLLGFRPTEGGKADVFVLGTKVDVYLDSLQAGDVYSIGPLAPFNGLYLGGVDIDEFWAGEKNFIETSDRAFVLTAGIFTVTERDSTYLAGTFFGTTDPNRNTLSKRLLLR